MMNYIWGFLILCGFGAFALSGDPAASVDAMLSGVSEALELCLALCPSFMLWLGLMNVAREAGLMEKLSRAARPLLKRLMPDSSEAMAPITLNLAANFLGLGSAATPFGIEAMAELQKAGMPGELVPLFLLRPFSGSAALAILRDIFDTCGADSFVGVAASVMLGSTETVFYTVSVYLGSAGVTKPRYCIAASLGAAIVGAASALVLARMAGV